MIATIITSPLDIVKTRLQSTLNANEGYRQLGNAMPQRNNIMYWIREAGRPVQETMSIVGTIRKNEGILALFRGLGPNLAGFVPATALKFLLYGNTKTALVGIYRSGKWVDAPQRRHDSRGCYIHGNKPDLGDKDAITA